MHQRGRVEIGERANVRDERGCRSYRRFDRGLDIVVGAISVHVTFLESKNVGLRMWRAAISEAYLPLRKLFGLAGEASVVRIHGKWRKFNDKP